MVENEARAEINNEEGRKRAVCPHVPLSTAPGMKARERGIDDVRSLPADVQQHQTAVGEEPVRAEGVLGVVPPGAVRELVEIRVGRHKEELLVVTAGLVSSSSSSSNSDELRLRSSILAARGRVARVGQCRRRLVGEIGWHSERIRFVDCRRSVLFLCPRVFFFLAFFFMRIKRQKRLYCGWCMLAFAPSVSSCKFSHSYSALRRK